MHQVSITVSEYARVHLSAYIHCIPWGPFLIGIKTRAREEQFVCLTADFDQVSNLEIVQSTAGVIKFNDLGFASWKANEIFMLMNTQLVKPHKDSHCQES